MFLLDSPSSDSATQPWTREQVWHLIKALAKSENGVMSYNQLLLSDLFKNNGENILQALEQAELISIVSENGCPQSVKPGKPIYHAVFRRLTENRPLNTRLNLAIIGQLVGNQNKSIEKYETELQALGTLPKQPSELRDRVQWLLEKIRGAQSKIRELEAEGADLSRLLKSEH